MLDQQYEESPRHLYGTSVVVLCTYRIRCNYSATTIEAPPSTGTLFFISKPRALHLPEF